MCSLTPWSSRTISLLLTRLGKPAVISILVTGWELGYGFRSWCGGCVCDSEHSVKAASVILVPVPTPCRDCVSWLYMTCLNHSLHQDFCKDRITFYLLLWHICLFALEKHSGNITRLSFWQQKCYKCPIQMENCDHGHNHSVAPVLCP